MVNLLNCFRLFSEYRDHGRNLYFMADLFLSHSATTIIPLKHLTNYNSYSAKCTMKINVNLIYKNIL